MQFSFSDILFTLVLFLLLFITVFLFTSDKGKRISNILIGSFFLALCLNLADSFLLLKQVYFQYPAWALWGSNLLLICGPLIYLYTQSVIYKDFEFNRRKLVHFIPFLFIFFISEISHLVVSHDMKIKILNNIISRTLPSSIYLVSCIIYVYFFVYLYLSGKAIKKYQIAASNQFADAQKVTLNWLTTTIYFFLALMVLSAVNGYLSFQSKEHAYFIGLALTISLLLLFIIFVLFKALRNPDVFSALEEKEIQAAILPVKNTSSHIQENEKRLLLEKLQQHMQTRRPYLESELSLENLSTQIAVKPKLLSQVINELMQQNFFEFINHYRIDEAKRLLNNPKDRKITVLEVMYQVGFNSKSSFNTLFKKETGITPSEFKKNSFT